MVFLCWNLNRRPLHHLVAELVNSERVDVIILIESRVLVADLLTALNVVPVLYSTIRRVRQA